MSTLTNSLNKKLIYDTKSKNSMTYDEFISHPSYQINLSFHSPARSEKLIWLMQLAPKAAGLQLDARMLLFPSVFRSVYLCPSIQKVHLWTLLKFVKYFKWIEVAGIIMNLLFNLRKCCTRKFIQSKYNFVQIEKF